MQKRVLRLITRLNVGGPTKHVRWLSEGLMAKGWEHLLVHGDIESNEDTMAPFVQEANIPMQLLPSLKRSIEPASDIQCLWELYRLLCQYQPSIVHTHQAKAGLLGRVAVWLYNQSHSQKIQTVHTFHGHTFHGYFSARKEKLFLSLERWLGKYATSAFVMISDQLQKEILEDFQVGRLEQMHRVNLGIDTQFASTLKKGALRHDLEIPDNHHVFGIVGRIAPIKNHALFLDSIAMFNQQNPNVPASFVIIGDGESAEVNGLQAQAEQQNLTNLYFAGNQTDPSYFYGSLNGLVLTSLNEGTPVCILEAFAAQIPVIATSVGGVCDLLGNQERGVQVPSQDANALAAAYENAIHSDPSNAASQVSEALKFVEANYSVDALVSNIERLYLHLLK